MLYFVCVCRYREADARGQTWGDLAPQVDHTPMLSLKCVERKNRVLACVVVGPFLFSFFSFLPSPPSSVLPRPSSRQFSPASSHDPPTLEALKRFGSVQRGEALDKFTSEFESGMIEVLTDRSHQPENVTTFTFVAKEFFQALESQAFKDAGMLLVGYLIVFIYVIIMIGRFSFVQQRFFLSLGGILGVIMGIIVSYGVCSAIGFWYSPAHTVIPFLMLGIGIDDMFVIIQCRNTLSQEQLSSGGVAERLGRTMEHAGVAITITSLTNFMAFGIGSTTQMPALRSFCMYAAIGILSIFFFQVLHSVSHKHCVDNFLSSL